MVGERQANSTTEPELEGAGASGVTSLADLLINTPDARIVCGASESIRSICFDSRLAGPNTLFVALRGAYADGHDFLQAARAKGATAALVDRDPTELNLDGFRAVAMVPDSRRALASVARTFYGHPSRDLRLIGITGTDGKTTTSFMTEHLLQSAGMSTGLISTVAIRLSGQPSRSAGRQTTPESLETQRLLAEMRDSGIDAVVLETSSHGLETHRVEGCLFDVGVITNITHEHIDFHGSTEAYRRAKARLIDLVHVAREDGGLGTIVANIDDPGVLSILDGAAGLDVVRYGLDGTGTYDVSAESIVATDRGFEFRLVASGMARNAELPVIGRWNVSNALAAVGICVALDVPIDRIAAGLASMPPVPGRMQMVDAGQSFRVIVDYAHTAPALEHVLKTARETTTGQVMVLFGSAGERDVEKRAEMGTVAGRLADYTVVTSEDPRFEDPEAIIDEIAAGLVEAGAVEGVDFDRLEDRRSAIEGILSKAGEGDTVVLAGKGHEQSMIYGSDHRPWDETAVALDVLRELNYSKT